MSDMVTLSRTNRSIMPNEEGAKSVGAPQALVVDHKPPFGRIWWHNSKNHPIWYLHAVILNHLEKYRWSGCQHRCKGFVRSLPICITRRYRDRAGKLDFYIRGIEPQERQS